MEDVRVEVVFEAVMVRPLLETAVRCEEVVDSLEWGRRVNVRSIVAVFEERKLPPPAEGSGRGFEDLRASFFCGGGLEWIGPRGPQAMAASSWCELGELNFVGFRSKDSMAPVLALGRRPLSVMIAGAGAAPLTACGVECLPLLPAAAVPGWACLLLSESWEGRIISA